MNLVVEPGTIKLCWVLPRRISAAKSFEITGGQKTPVKERVFECRWKLISLLMLRTAR